MRYTLKKYTAQALRDYLAVIYGIEYSPDDPVWISYARNGTKGFAIGKQALSDICKKWLGTGKVEVTYRTYEAIEKEYGNKGIENIENLLGINEDGSEGLSASILAETSEIPPVFEFHQASALPLSQVEMRDEQASLAVHESENKGVVSHDRDEEHFDGTDELTGSLQLEENMLNMSALTVQQVNNTWERVRKRTKQKSKSGLTAAYLGYYKIIAIEGTAEQPIVVIQAAKQAHFDYMKANDRYKDLEWALEMEFGLLCRVRLVSPNAIPQTQNPSRF